MIELLSQQTANWVDVAKAVLAGDHDHADGSTKEALLIGLRGTAHDKCLNAVARLEGAPEHKPVKVAKQTTVKRPAAKGPQGGLF